MSNLRIPSDLSVASAVVRWWLGAVDAIDAVNAANHGEREAESLARHGATVRAIQAARIAAEAVQHRRDAEAITRAARKMLAEAKDRDAAMLAILQRDVKR